MRKTQSYRTAVALSLAVGVAALAPSLAAPPPSAKKMASYANLGVTPGKPGGSYTLVLGDSPPTFMYYGAIDANTQTVMGQILDGLIEYNLATLRIEPALAESWTTSTDGKVWTFKLREGVRWHDGVEFTADDVIFTYEQVVTNPEARGGDVGEFTLGGQKVTFSKVDKYTVRFTLPTANGPFLQKVRKPILPKHQLVRSTVEGGGRAADINSAWATNSDLTKIVGTGPFRLTSYTPGQKVTLVKNPNYWKVDSAGTALPYLERLEFLIVRGGEAQAAQFLSGALDAYNLSAAQFPDFKSREVGGANFKVSRNDTFINSIPHLAFNFNARDADLARLFSDLRFRQAMQSGLNRARIIDAVYNGLAQLPGHGVAAGSSFYTDTKRYLGEYNAAAANAALDGLGLRDTNGNGVRNISASKELEFTLNYGSDSTTWTPMATVVQDNYKQIGVRVNLRGIPSAQLLTAARGKDWDATFVAFGNQPDPDLRKPIWQPGGELYYWHQATHPATPGGRPVLSAMTSWERRLYDIFERGSVTTDQGIRGALYDEWQVIMARSLPVIMIAQPPNLAAVRNSIGNFVFTTYVIPGHNPVPLIFNR